MDIKLHKLVRTTPSTRRYIQTAPTSAATLARELGVAVTTIYEWDINGSAIQRCLVRLDLARLPAATVTQAVEEFWTASAEPTGSHPG